MSFRIGLSFDKTHFTCNWVDLGWFKSLRNMLFKSRVKAMQICQETSELVLYFKTRQLAQQIVSIEV